MAEQDATQHDEADSTKPATSDQDSAQRDGPEQPGAAARDTKTDGTNGDKGSGDKGSADKGSGEAKDDGKDKGKTDSASAQQKATDPENARKWRSVGLGMDAALAALLGGGRTNVFFGETTIGMLGDRIRPMTSTQFGELVRSGTVPEAVLNRIRDSYVEPTRYLQIKQVLENKQAVFVRTDSGTGRTATALRLLDDVCAEGVRKLDPDAKLKTLNEQDLVENHGYLLESLDAEQAQEFQAFHAERLTQLMYEKGCRLIVIVDRTTPLRMTEISDRVVEDLGVVQPEWLVRRHVVWGLHGTARVDQADVVLGRPEVKEILAQLTEDMAHRELAELAALLVEVAHDRIGIDAVRERYLRASEANFLEWFDQQADTEQRAFVIALSVFNNESVQLVSEAATWLANEIRAAESRRRGDRTRSVFTTSLQKRLQDARAELFDSTQETVFGKVPVQKARFRDDRFPRKILEHVCSQYDQVHDVVRDWLLKLGGIPGPDVRIRAGMAAGLLSLFDFVGIYNTVIEPWADSGDVDNRWAAAAALRIPGQHPAMARVVYQLLTNWIRQKDVPNRRVTAVQALGTTEAMSPGAALKLLRYASRRADLDMAFTIGESISELFCRVDDPGQVLRALVKWTDDNEFPERRETGLLSVLIMSSYVIVSVAKSSEKWPVLVWAADTVPEHRELVVTLFSRMLQAAEFMQHGYSELYRWVKIAQKDKTLREPLARLLFDIGAMSEETDSIRYYLEYWASQRNGPADAVRAVLAHFAPERNLN